MMEKYAGISQSSMTDWVTQIKGNTCLKLPSGKGLKVTEILGSDTVIQKAIISCRNSGNEPDNHYTHLPTQVNPKGLSSEDWKLTCYACYLVSMNGDPSKPEIAAATLN
jgi:hypothetical protein